MSTDIIPVVAVSGIQFYVAGSEENEQDGFVHVQHKETFTSDGLPYTEGTYDPHMGTTDHSWVCATCQNTQMECPGHNGYLKLNYPAQSPLYKDAIMQWLKIICFECATLLVVKRIRAPAHRLMPEYVSEARSGNKPPTCPNCRVDHPRLVRDKNDQTGIYIERTDPSGLKKLELVPNTRIAEIFERISEETLTILGKSMESHPRKFIIDTVSVPPNTLRPDIKRGTGLRSGTSDTTIFLKTLVDNSSRIPREIEEFTDVIRSAIANQDLILYEMLVGSKTSTRKTRLHISSNRAPASIASRIPGKYGRPRKTLMGKRVTQMARCTITGDPTLKIDELGMPLAVAREIQIPEVVHPWNIDRLMRYFLNGRRAYPGCSRIKKASNDRTYYVDKLRPGMRLEVGDIIFRDIVDGDYVGFNRQPSLTYCSISSMRVVVDQGAGNTFRMNVSACNLFNADFDGDAMNAIIPRSRMSRTEIKYLMSVGRWLISYKDGAPVVGAFQDGLIGLAMFTWGLRHFDKFRAMRMFSGVREDYRLPDFDAKSFTNRELVSMLLPHISYSGQPSMYRKDFTPFINYDPDDIQVKIVRGKLETGIIDKATAGQGRTGSIVHIASARHGSRVALDMTYALQQLVGAFIADRGFSLGIGDMLISHEALAVVHDKTAALIENAQRITDRLFRGEIIPPIGKTVAEYYEELVSNALELGDDFFEPVMGDIDINTNQLAQLIITGSKGKLTNMQMISSAIGQQTNRGFRMREDFGNHRTLIYFTSYDTDPIARGFVPNSYIGGVGVDRFWFTAVDARQSLTAKALSTSETGEQNRKGIKNLESAIVDNNRTTAKANRVVQVIYGQSGIDPRSMEQVRFPTMDISNDDFAKYQSKVGDCDKKFRNAKTTALLGSEFEQLTADREFFREVLLKLEIDAIGTNQLYNSRRNMPINIERIIRTNIFEYRDQIGADLFNPIEAIERVERLCRDVEFAPYNENYARKNKEMPEHWQRAAQFVKILLRSCLCTQVLIRENIGSKLLDIICTEVLSTFRKAFVEYGTAMGIIAAQSFSEPLTQYVLDSHHRSGTVGSKTEKIHRVKELFGVRPTDRMANPSMMVLTPEGTRMNKLRVQEVANHLEMMPMENFISEANVFYEEFGNSVHPKYMDENKIVAEFIRNNPVAKPPSDLTKWCIRFELIRNEMVMKNMTLDTIVLKLIETYPLLYFVYSPENAERIIMRVYVRNDAIKKVKLHAIQTWIVNLASELRAVVVRGVPDIKYADVVKIPQTYVDDDGSIQTRQIWAIQTDGSNLLGMLAHPMIDPYTVQTDSVVEIAEVYGIEAARQKVLNEMKFLVPDTVYQHYSVYADEMSYTGHLTSIERTGLSKRERDNIMLRISNSAPIQVIQEAAQNAVYDSLDGVSAKLMVGSSPEVGSAYNKLVLNEEFIREHTQSLDSILDDL